MDIVAAGDAPPVRLEFIGDTIETLRTYDPATQRSVAPIDRLYVVPLKDVLARPSTGRAELEELDRSATLFDYISRARDARIVVSERDEVDTHVTKLVEQLHHSYEEAVGRFPSTRIAPPAELFAEWSAIEARLGQATTISQLGLDESPGPESQIPNPESLPIRCQPRSRCTAASPTGWRRSAGFATPAR